MCSSAKAKRLVSAEVCKIVAYLAISYPCGQAFFLAQCSASCRYELGSKRDK